MLEENSSFVVSVKKRNVYMGTIVQIWMFRQFFLLNRFMWSKYSQEAAKCVWYGQIIVRYSHTGPMKRSQIFIIIAGKCSIPWKHCLFIEYVYLLICYLNGSSLSSGRNIIFNNFLSICHYLIVVLWLWTDLKIIKIIDKANSFWL